MFSKSYFGAMVMALALSVADSCAAPAPAPKARRRCQPSPPNSHRRGSKLARRIRRKFELGRAGAF